MKGGANSFREVTMPSLPSDLPPGVHGPIPPDRFLPYLTGPEITALDKTNAAVVLPVGAIEQHGPHLPVATDTLTGTTVLGRALARLDRGVECWALPPTNYGKSNEHVGFGGTFTLSAGTLIGLLADVAASAARSGFRRLVLLNSHGGNVPLVDMVARDIRVETGLMVFPLHLQRLAASRDFLTEHERLHGMHAGDGETSTILALAPELVKLDRRVGEVPVVPEGFALPTMPTGVPFAWLTSDFSESGVCGNNEAASREKGEQIVELAVTRLAEALEAICRFEMPRGTVVFRAGERSQT
jgi:creatinine amidohydrolase/Fe(II)-dependent formamide hydrolase-like protein